MSRLSVVCAVFALLSVFAVSVNADLYLHNPRGSNNRLNEQSANRQNGDRLFDSQNNNRGGYNVGDRSSQAFDASTPATTALDPVPLYDRTVINTRSQYQMVYYEGSELSVEWTNQHGCGGRDDTDPYKLNCDLVLQYMCQTTDGTLDTNTGRWKQPSDGVIMGAESLRDGSTTDTPKTINAATDAVPTENALRGHHESEQYYYECSVRSRNKGLFTADQRLNGDTAQYTRQNPNGNRRGFECPEERDYWPYWSPSPWKDIVLMTDQADSKCNADGTYKGRSQNNHFAYKCYINITSPAAKAATATIDAQSCVTAGGEWRAYTHNIAAPKCQQAEWSRVNHLGNGRRGQPLTYNWTLPTIAELVGDVNSPNIYTYTDAATGAKYAKCVLRMRYNISTDDYDGYNTTSRNNQNPEGGVISPVTQNPTVDIGAGYDGVLLAVNTAQFGRVFQDRSHVFYIRSRPPALAGKKIHNLNVRGKRGNIVQVFPSVEYDFVPSRLVINSDDYVHVQWTGSNTHNNGDPAGDGQAGDAGEGRGGTDRSNIAQIQNFNENYPIPLDKYPDNMWTRSSCYGLDGAPLTAGKANTPGADFTANPAALDCAIHVTTSGQYSSLAAIQTAQAGGGNFDPLLDDAPASLIGGVLMRFDNRSTSYDYICTRNNNFSNRSQKGTIVVVAP